MSEVGVGKTYKPYTLTLRKAFSYNNEDSGVAKTAGNRTTSITNPLRDIGGPIEEPPTMTPKNKTGAVKKHDQIGENYKVLKLGFEGELSYKYSLENWRGLYYAMGGVIDQPIRLEVTTPTDVDADEIITGSSSGAKAAIASGYTSNTSPVILKAWVQGELVDGSTAGNDVCNLLMIRGNIMYFDPTAPITNIAPAETVTGAAGAVALVDQQAWVKIPYSSLSNSAGFVIGELITETTSTATGIVTHMDATDVYLQRVSGTFTGGQTLTGGINSYTATGGTMVVLAVSLVEFTDGEAATTDGVPAGAIASIDDQIFRHYIFGYHAPPSFSGTFHHESLATQHLMTGLVCTEFGMECISNDVPKVSETWIYAEHGFDDTVDAGVTNVDTTLYDYTDISFTLNGVEYCDIYKSVKLTVSRDVKPFHGKSLTPKGMTQAELSFKVEASILREDKAIHNFRINDTSFDGVFTFRRGTANEDEAIWYFDTTNGDRSQLRALEIGEAEDDSKIMLEADFQVEGKPVVVVFDKTAHYG